MVTDPKTHYCMTRGKVIFDYSALYCDTPEKLLKSELFRRVLTMFIERCTRKGGTSADFLAEKVPGMGLDETAGVLVNLFRLLMSHVADEVAGMKKDYGALLSDREGFFELREDLYNYWRSRERFLYVVSRGGARHTRHDILHTRFIKTNAQFKDLVLHTYRTIGENVIDANPRVYRQLPSGANIGMLLERIDWDCPERYSHLKEVPFVELALIDPPLILYPRENKRRGPFEELGELTDRMLSLDPDEWLCYPARVGELTCFVYFHRDFISLGLSLANLFEIIDHDDIRGRRPDSLLLFGVADETIPGGNTVYYQDDSSGMMVGMVKYSEEVDYFGYFKKMALTLHNVTMLNRGRMPVHGAMVSLKLKDGSGANIAIIGDSGAGKSETLMALVTLAEEYISEMRVVFDDMGSLALRPDGRVAGYGTEIGAFVRLDDLEPGYAYEEIDRSIFMNPDKVNARLIIPITHYSHVVKGYPVDILLYANNYEEVDGARPAIELFKGAEEALKVFRDGARRAKGTTDEKGLVHTYFGNPFGAPQRKDQHEKCAGKIFDALFASKTLVGQFRNRLAVKGYELEGPREAARELFTVIKGLSKNKEAA